jgi:VWFA-related protein
MTRPRAFTAFVGVSGVLFGTGLWLCAAAAPAAPGSPGESRQDRQDRREHSMFVSVVDQDGAPVADLGPTDFVVKEDNRTREVLRVGPADEPMQIAILVDTSQAAQGEIAHIRQALPPFVATLTTPNAAGRRNEIAIIGIGERPTILSDYSTDPTQIAKGVDRIWSLRSSGMYLLDAIVEVSQGLKKREAVRPVMIAIATSGIEYSNRQHDQALDPLKATGVAFYALMLGQADTSLRPEARERAIVLDEGPRATGGYNAQLLTGMALTPKLKQLADQLTHQYKLTYSRPESLIPPEKITVSVARPGLAARGTPVREGLARP